MFPKLDAKVQNLGMRDWCLCPISVIPNMLKKWHLFYNFKKFRKTYTLIYAILSSDNYANT